MLALRHCLLLIGLTPMLVGPVSAQDAPRMLSRLPVTDTALVRGGRVLAAVVIPADPAYRPLADKINAAIRAVCGADLPVLTDAEACDRGTLRPRPDLQRKPLIILGNINNNLAMVGPYAMFYTCADAYWPGGDGFALKTCTNLYNTNTNHLLIAASTLSGCARGVDEFCRAIAALKGPDLILPRLHRVVPGGEFAQECPAPGPVPEKGQASDYTFGSAARAYQFTGAEAFGKAARVHLLALIAAARPGFPCTDYSLETIARGYGYLRDSGILSAAEILQADNACLQTALALQDQYWRVHGAGSLGTRHQTMGTSAFYAVTRLLSQHGAPNPAAKALLDRWNAEGRAYLHKLLGAYREDADENPSFDSAQVAFTYALEEPDLGFFDETKGPSFARLAAERAYANIDNVGYYAGVGHYEEARPGTIKRDLQVAPELAWCAWYYKDPEYNWLLHNVRGMNPRRMWAGMGGVGRHGWVTDDGVGAQKPERFLGLLRFPFSRYHWDILPRDEEALKGRQGWFTEVPYEQTFDKMIFREGYDPNDAYLMLQGCQNGFTSGAEGRTMDGNCIVRYSDRGHVWLVHNTDRMTHYYRNGVYVSNGSNVGREAPLVRLDGQGPNWVTTTLPDHKGTDWTRTIVRVKGRYFVVLDRLVVKEPGQFSMNCIWRTPEYATLAGDTWTCQQGNDVMTLKPSEPVWATSQLGEDEGACRPYTLRQVKSLTAKSGDVVSFQNLLQCPGPGARAGYSIRKLTDAAVIVKGDDELALIGAQGGTFGDLEVPGETFCLSAHDPGPALASVQLNGRPVTSFEQIRPALEALWAAAAPEPGAVAGPPQLPTRAARASWTFDGFTKRHKDIPSLSVSSDRKPNPDCDLGDLTDKVLPLWMSTNFPAPDSPTLTFDLGHSESLSEIHLYSPIASVNTLPANLAVKDALKGTVDYGDALSPPGNSKADVTFDREVHLERLHKGEMFVFYDYVLRNINRTARVVRLQVPGWGTGYTEVSFRNTDLGDTSAVDAITADLTGDGKRAILAWSDNYELVALTATGLRELWRQRLLGAITCVHAADLDGDGRQEVLVGARDMKVHCFSPEGRELWACDMKPMADTASASPTPYSLGTRRIPGTKAREVVIGNYGLSCFLSADGKFLGSTACGGAFEVDMLPEGIDLNGDGVEDQAVRHNWAAIALLDGAKREMMARVPAVSGWGLGMRQWQAAPSPQCIVCSENGVGVYDLRERKAIWQWTPGPISGWAIGGQPGARRVYLARRDGFLLILDEQGRLVQTSLLGEELRDLALTSVGGETQIVVAADSRLVLCDATGKPTSALDLRAVRLKTLDDGSLLALGGDGRISVLPSDGGH